MSNDEPALARDPTVRVEQRDNIFEHEVVDGDEVLSSLVVWDFQMRIGVSQVRMGGIGGVETPRKHRNKGYARRCMEHSNAWMEKEGFDCAVLFGIPDFYHKFGYAPCLSSTEWSMPTRDAERAELRLRVRPFEDDDLPALREIYSANNAALTGSIVRNENSKWARKGSWYGVHAEMFVFEDNSGRIAAYAVRDKATDRSKIVEVGAIGAAHYPSLIRWAADYAVECRSEAVVFLVPEAHPCGQAMIAYGAKRETTYPRNGSGMGRIIRLNPFVEKTLPEWTRRAQWASRPGSSIGIETDIGNATLSLLGGEVVCSAADAAGTVRLPQFRLMQLAMGYYDAQSAIHLPDVETAGDPTFFNTLFPRCTAYMWSSDHY